MQHLKLPQWIKMGKDILNENPDAVVCLSEQELFHFINDRIPITNKLSYDYIRKLLNEDYCERNGSASFELQQDMENLRKFWRTAKITAHVGIYSKMMTDDKAWMREFKVLERRFKDSWAEQKEQIAEQSQVTINIIEDKE